MGALDTIDLIALALVIIGALNWLLVGAVNFNLVEAIFGFGVIARILYIIVGVAGLYLIYFAYDHMSVT